MTRRRTLLLFAIAVSATGLAGFQAARKVTTMDDPLIAGFKKTTVASVADAVDQVIGQRGYMSHKIRPAVAGQVVGRARTSIVKPTTPDKATPALAVKHSVEMIDSSKPGEVGVIVMEDGLDVAAIGGLMGTAAKARGMAGIVIDGGVRDVGELRALGLPVYSSSITPATAVSRWASVDKDVPVQCGGITVTPGDIIVAGEDGIVVVPAARAAEVLKRAQEIDERETKMVPFIKQQKSLGKVIAMFNRI
jgi:regulator of RNase E activity RraA